MEVLHGLARADGLQPRQLVCCFPCNWVILDIISSHGTISVLGLIPQVLPLEPELPAMIGLAVKAFQSGSTKSPSW